MTQQKLFTEFPVPKKVYFTVAVRTDDPDTCECAVANCKTAEDTAEYAGEDVDVWQCDCCGGWFCIHHIDENSDVCIDCVKLPPVIRAQIEAFREEVNR